MADLHPCRLISQASIRYTGNLPCCLSGCPIRLHRMWFGG